MISFLFISMKVESPGGGGGGGVGGVDSHIKSDRDTRRKIKIKLLRETNVGVVLQGGKT